jgi:hypothetical protein
MAAAVRCPIVVKSGSGPFHSLPANGQATTNPAQKGRARRGRAKVTAANTASTP